MAFNEILVGRINRWVQKLLVIKNTALRSLSPELQTVLPIFSGVEERYLQGWNRFTISSGTIAAGAAVVSGMRLRNPIGSGILVVVEKVYITPQAVDAIVNAANCRIDPRGNPTPTAIISTGTLASPQATNASFDMLVGPTFNPSEWVATTNQEITVMPGDAFTPQCRLVNTAVAVAILWRERPLESSELT